MVSGITFEWPTTVSSRAFLASTKPFFFCETSSTQFLVRSAYSVHQWQQEIHKSHWYSMALVYQNPRILEKNRRKSGKPSIFSWKVPKLPLENPAIWISSRLCVFLSVGLCTHAYLSNEIFNLRQIFTEWIFRNHRNRISKFGLQFRSLTLLLQCLK